MIKTTLRESLLKALGWVMMNITQHKRGGKMLRGGASSSEERCRDLFENANDIVCTTDLQGNFTSVNKAGERISGYTSDELLRMNIAAIVAPEFLEVVRAMVDSKLAGAAPGVYELEIVAKNGHKVPLEVSSRLICENGSPVEVQAIARDVSDRRQLEHQLRQAQRMEAVGRLASGIAHDFNNILTIVTGYKSLIMERLDADNPLRRDVEGIGKAVERATSLTRQLMTLSRKQPTQLKVMDLNDLLGNMQKMLRPLIGEDIQLISNLSPQLGCVKADPGQIEQIILNLAVNARDAMPNGGKLIIDTRNVDLDESYVRRHICVTPGHYVMLAVSDTGIGMDKETLSHIFEPFFTTKEPGKGTGLGLSTVYGIVKHSGGGIWPYSELRKGTTFKIYLPRVDEKAESLELSQDSDRRLQGSETILLVEDEEELRALGTRMLRANGYTALEASNGAQAIDICRRFDGPIHLMVTDVVMPGISVRQLVQQVTSLHPKMKVLYMSGHTNEIIAHHGVWEAGRNLLQKPFGPDALARAVREILDSSKHPDLQGTLPSRNERYRSGTA